MGRNANPITGYRVTNGSTTLCLVSPPLNHCAVPAHDMTMYNIGITATNIIGEGSPVYRTGSKSFNVEASVRIFA